MPTIVLSQAVGLNAPNLAVDVKPVAARLVEIGKLAADDGSGKINDALLQGIAAMQRHFLLVPDQKIDPGGSTLRYLNQWSQKTVSPGVQLAGRLLEAWTWVSPLLPAGSFCSSGFRSADEQRQILQKFFKATFRADIIAKYGQKAWDAAAVDMRANESQVLLMVRGVGQQIAAPGASMHQQGKAVDIGGPDDVGQVQVVEMVARAHPTLFTGKVLKERNGCVHFEIY